MIDLFSRVLPMMLVVALAGCVGKAMPPRAAAVSSPPAASLRDGVAEDPSSAAPARSSAAQSDPNAIAVAAARALASSDTTRDANPYDTVRRNSLWLTAAFAASVVAFPPVTSAGARWAGWAGHRAYLRVTAVLVSDEHPADTATTAARQVVERVTPIGRDGWKGSHFTQVAFLTFGRVSGVWQISSYQTSSN
jgi:hypothetical protein